MSGCVHCGKAQAGYSFQALEVRTIHLRELGGERRVQGLGDLRRCRVCRDCAQHYLEEVLRPRRVLLRQGLPFAAVLLLGVLVLAGFRTGHRPFEIFGGAGVLCGAVGLVSVVRTALQRRRTYSALPREEALERAAWECALSELPRKEGDADVTYIPQNAETAAMGVSELACRFDLLAPIAGAAAERMAQD